MRRISSMRPRSTRAQRDETISSSNEKLAAALRFCSRVNASTKLDAPIRSLAAAARYRALKVATSRHPPRNPTQPRHKIADALLEITYPCIGCAHRSVYDRSSCPPLARVGHRHPSIIRPLWRSRTTSLNGDHGRKPVAAPRRTQGLLTTRSGPKPRAASVRFYPLGAAPPRLGSIKTLSGTRYNAKQLGTFFRELGPVTSTRF